MTGPQTEVAHVFAELTDTLVNDFDLVDFLHTVATRSQQTLGVDAVGLLLADNHGGLNVVAASGAQAQVLELFQLQHDEGPCPDCYRTGLPVKCPDLAAEASRWPHFVPQAIDAGFAAVHALPMRLRDTVIGGMNLFTASPGGLDPELLSIAQALTDVATIAILQERAIRERDLLTEQLQAALNSQLAVEQAKGIVAERTNVTINEAFDILRNYAHLHNQKLAELADAVVRNDPAVADVANLPAS